MLDFTDSLSRSYSARLESSHAASMRETECRQALTKAYYTAALDNPSATVRIPRVWPDKDVHVPIAELIHGDIDQNELAALLRDAAKGEDVQLRASLLLSVLAGSFAELHAGDMAVGMEA